MFDNIPSYCLSVHTVDEVSRYLCTEPEDISNNDLLSWWLDHHRQYPRLYQMALNYHTIPYKCWICFITTHAYLLCFLTTTGSSVGIERIFSQGCLLLPHMCNHLSSESMHALLCLGDWSTRGLVKDCNIKTAAVLPDILGVQEPEF